MTDGQIWLIALALGVGTFALRFSFLGLIGARRLPGWLESALRYTPVAVLPGLVAPAILFPAATAGQIDPMRLAVAAVTLAVGLWTRSALHAILAGIAAAGIGVALGLF